MAEEKAEKIIVVGGIEISVMDVPLPKKKGRFSLVVIKDKRGRTYFEIKENE